MINFCLMKKKESGRKHYMKRETYTIRGGTGLQGLHLVDF